jgi:hypothetical protein
MRSILFFLLLPCYLFCLPIQERTISQELMDELFCEFDIRGNICLETQKKWLRQSQKERWEIEELPIESKLVVLEWAKRAQLFEEWIPKLNHYDKAIILGATTPTMELRLKYLSELFERGVTFDELVFLTAERPLDRRVDHFCDQCFTETEAAKLIWKRGDLPKKMKAIHVSFYSAPMVGLNRPTTRENMKSWLSQNQNSSTCLFVSNQPHAIYQYAVIKNNLPESCLFDVVAAGGQQKNTAIILDMLARWIYEKENP